MMFGLRGNGRSDCIVLRYRGTIRSWAAAAHALRYPNPVLALPSGAFRTLYNLVACSDDSLERVRAAVLTTP